ncbi:chloroplast envelope membrane protein isoform X2 [Andrographis paniculata]|uniref:chloroplast envelope membrane protein isoform X2 n=1 Tax=Andrographis paniculata TaxID=175694 RepID=UPI0021E773EF|nr:chloroplast envelope membrane protein isoform X2 [Andrographis paniculata]XP_051132091.1 chloroplast envelope membrane protein isoform X2 [Andrographis paniculata]XP_051132092.1 chloroplast envelope membrane protein isoform X2 [Andrographis paniculata]
MFFMSTSMVLCQNLVISKNCSFENSLLPCCNASCGVVKLGCRRRKSRSLVPKAKKRRPKKKSWWQRFFFDEDGNWLGLKDDYEDMVDLVESEGSSTEDDLTTEYEKFEAWRRRAEAIVELREAQEDVKNEEDRRWEDWLVDGSTNNGNAGGDASWSENSPNSLIDKPGNDVGKEFSEFFSERGLVKSVRDAIVGREDDDILYEDRVFRYASYSSAKFLAVLIIVPWALDFLVHDYVLMPFLDRYVKKVPLAAELLDVRRSQKLEMVKTLNLEKARYRLEVEIGKSPPLSDEDLYSELRHKALELRDERRLENRKAFANIWSDGVFGISLFMLLYFCQSQVALLKFTGYKLLNNITDTGKAFLIILVTDIFLGYHSESGWQTLLEIIFEHYGFEVDSSAITIFVCIIPVIMDACVKLWLFKFLPKLSPKVSNIFQEMKRH